MKTNLIAGLVAVVVMIIAVVALSGGSDDASIDVASGGKDPTATTVATTEATTTTIVEDTGTTIVEDTVIRFSDLETIWLDELPTEALSTLALIDQGGPYPYRQDHGTFQNREGILPDRNSDHYREYTVDTPGSSDRGARRIVAGSDGERYYTDDHYDSFREIIQ